jgi:hypothetical protein
MDTIKEEPVQDDTERRRELTKLLRLRYPNQKFGAPDSEYVIDNEAETDLLMWTRVIDFARQGMFDRIRPDILVNNYCNLVALRDAHVKDTDSKDASNKENE